MLLLIMHLSMKKFAIIWQVAKFCFLVVTSIYFVLEITCGENVHVIDRSNIV